MFSFIQIQIDMPVPVSTIQAYRTKLTAPCMTLTQENSLMDDLLYPTGNSPSTHQTGGWWWWWWGGYTANPDILERCFAPTRNQTPHNTAHFLVKVLHLLPQLQITT